jgi:PPM family protein phosphatase
MEQKPVNWDAVLEHAALSDVGLRRANNQDSMAVALAGTRERFLMQGHVFVVADGMGAHAAGELASKMAADIVPLTYCKMVDLPRPEALCEAVRDANTQIFNRGQASDDFRGMGTTADTLVLLASGALIAHVGDSRVYRWRGRRIEQLTFDHSLVWELRAAGHIPDDEIPWHIPTNVITRSLGPNPEVKIDLEGPFPTEVGDTFLLCSDGLSGQVEDREIGTLLGCLAPKDAVRALINLAILRGGPDNITAVVARVTGPLDAISGPDCDGPPPQRKGGSRRADSIVRGLFGLFAVVALLSLISGSTAMALASLVAAAVTGLVGWGYRNGIRSDRKTDEPPLGGGPYVQVDCPADATFVSRLSTVIRELRSAAQSGNWSVDWSQFDAFEALAEESAQANDHVQAVREYCRAMDFMMDELKNQRGPQQEDGDASVLDP